MKINKMVPVLIIAVSCGSIADLNAMWRPAGQKEMPPYEKRITRTSDLPGIYDRSPYSQKRAAVEKQEINEANGDLIIQYSNGFKTVNQTIEGPNKGKIAGWKAGGVELSQPESALKDLIEEYNAQMTSKANL